MAAENETGEKTEDPSARRLSTARMDGMIAKSYDLAMLANITTSFILLQCLAPSIWERMKLLFVYSLSYNVKEDPISSISLHEKLIRLLLLMGLDLTILIFVTAVAGSLAVAIQTNFLFSTKLLKPKFGQLNPLQGLKRIFSLRNAINLLKSAAKLAIIAPIAYFAFIEFLPQIVNLMSTSITGMMPFVSNVADTIFWRIANFLLLLSVLDYSWEFYKNKRELMMTKQEIKEERKSVEGDEQVKNSIKSKGFARIRQRLMKEVPKADVIVTNPTHYAVALKYDPKESPAPLVLAKGQDFMAQRIKEIAKEHNIPCIERKPLAQALFKNTEVGQQIPANLFTAVAELLAYVYKLKRKNPFIQ